MSVGSAHHEFQVADDGIHSPFFATYTNAANRIADTRATGPRVVPGDTGSSFRALATEDVNKLALQTDDNSVWLLLTTTPTWLEIGGGSSVSGPIELAPKDFHIPVTADAAVSDFAPLVPDATNSGASVLAFSSTVKQSAEFTIMIPSTATNMKLTYIGRPASAPASAQVAKFELYQRGIPDAGSFDAWSSATALADASMTANVSVHYDSDDKTLATWGVTAGELTNFSFVRNATDAGDTLDGIDYNLLRLLVEFS